jgi:diguanylate cyclase (GGDEF)-like protein/PAS domain S-box-containing protein
VAHHWLLTDNYHVVAALHPEEKARLAKLQSLDVLDSLVEHEFNDLVLAAADLLDVPISLISLIDEDRQWFKAKTGVAVCETSRDVAFCAHAILQAEPLVVPDATLDPRFCDNDLVTGDFHLRFYAGAQIVVDGYPMGTLCCIDTKTRTFSPRQVKGLERLAGQASTLLQYRLLAKRLSENEVKILLQTGQLVEREEKLSNALVAATSAQEMSRVAATRFEHLFKGLPVACFTYDSAGTVQEWNSAAERLWGIAAHEASQEPVVGTAVSEKNLVAFKNITKRVFEGETVSDVEHTETLLDGSIRWLLTSTIPLKDGAGTVVGALSANIDVTESRVATNDLRLTKESLARAQSIAKVGSWEMDVVSGDTQWSDEMFRIFGYSPEEPTPSFAETLSRTHADDIEAVTTCFQDSLQTGKDCEFFQRLVLPDGKERVIRALCHPVPHEGRLVGTAQDVTELKRMEGALLKSEARFHSAIYSMHEGLVVQNDSDGIVVANERACEILGLTMDQLKGRSSLDPRWRAVREDGTDWPGETHPTTVALRDRVEQNNQIMGIHKPTGELTWVSINAVPLFHGMSTVAYAAVVTFTDITERRTFEAQIALQSEQIQMYAGELESQKGALELANVRLSTLAATDGLTGINNHRTFQERFEVAHSVAARSSRPLSITMVDVDRFKTFNDDFGHQAGDVVLKRVASILEQASRKGDVVARYGGEEFVILMPDTDSSAAMIAAERFRLAIQSDLWEDRDVTASFGVATLMPSMGRDDLLKAADDALYVSKESGRNRVTHFGELTPTS